MTDPKPAPLPAIELDDFARLLDKYGDLNSHTMLKRLEEAEERAARAEARVAELEKIAREGWEIAGALATHAVLPTRVKEADEALARIAEMEKR
jgi:hypothetical protein